MGKCRKCDGKVLIMRRDWWDETLFLADDRLRGESRLPRRRA